jgi:hypothetical protein
VVRQPSPLPVRVVANPIGGGEISVDGVDLTDGTTALQLTVRDDGPALLQLWRRSDAVVIDGAAVVKVVGDGYADAAQALREMDVDTLKAEALKNSGLGGGDLVAQVIEMAAQALESM